MLFLKIKTSRKIYFEKIHQKIKKKVNNAEMKIKFFPFGNEIIKFYFHNPTHNILLEYCSIVDVQIIYPAHSVIF